MPLPGASLMKVVLLFWKSLLTCTLVMLAAPTSAVGEELVGSEWHLIRIGSSAVSPPSKLSIQFKGGGKLTGHGGCNRFFGQYKITADKIEIGPVGATRMTCPGPIMNLEIAFFAVLETAKTFHRDKTNLLLLDETGKEQARLIQAD